MKRKHISIISIVLLFTLLSTIGGLWLAHTRFIDSGMASLSEYLESKSLKLKHSPISFSKNGVIDIHANIKNLSISYESAGTPVINYNIDDVVIHSNIWKGELDILITGEVKLHSKFNNKEEGYLIKFTTTPIIKINFKDPFTRTWTSHNLIKMIELPPVGYSMIDHMDSNIKTISSVESINLTLEKFNIDQENSPWELKGAILNQEYFANDSDEDLYKLMASTGKNNLTLDCLISHTDSKGPETDVSNVIELRELKSSTALFSTSVTGDISTLPKSSIPYLELNVKIDNIGNMVSYYFKIFDELARLNGRSDNSNQEHKKEKIDDILNIINSLSNSKDAESINLTIELKKDNFLISGIPASEVFQKINSLFKKTNNTESKVRKK